MIFKSKFPQTVILFTSLLDLSYFRFCFRTTTVDRGSLKSFGPGRLLATLLCLLPLSLRPVMFECLSLLIVSLSLVGMLFLVFLLVFSMVLALHVDLVQFRTALTFSAGSRRFLPGTSDFTAISKILLYLFS